MKTNRFFTVMALSGLVAFTSCSVNDDNETYDGAVRFTAGIDQVATPQTPGASRAAGTQWGSDAIGIFMVEPLTTLVVENAENRQYTTTGDGKFTPATGQDIYYPMDDSEVKFIAYYPHKPGATLTTALDVMIETTQDAANQPLFDLLYSENGRGRKPNGATAVNLEFNHMLSKIVMNCTAGEGLQAGDLTDMTVSIKGMNTKSTFILENGTLGATNSPEDITPRQLPNSTNYDAIILPATATTALGDLSVHFTITDPITLEDETFIWNMPAGTEFKAGHEYIYAVTIKRTGVTVTGTIKEWTLTPKGNVIAE